MEYKYSTRQLWDMVEVIEVYDSLKDIAIEKEKAEQAKLSANR